MMNWDKLISDKRLGLENYNASKGGVRNDFERDYDRLVFSSMFRRMHNKTQVFPLPNRIFVHNRLTHSLEVSCVGKSMAREVEILLRKKYDDQPWCDKLHDMGEIVAAACLAHDLGNPPFGHSGEKTIGAFFTEGRGLALRKHLTDDEWNDLTHFEGNANSFRALVHQFKGRRPGGFAMTYSTLASIVKYPYSSAQAGDKGKFGFFCSEKDSYECIAAELGIKRKPDGRYCRHPLVYLVEAADDICYQIMDIEDGHKLKLISTEETSALMLSLHDDDQHDHMREIMALVADPNEKIAYLRSAAVGLLVKECVRAFVDHEQEILSGTFQGSLIDNISPRVAEGYQRISKVAREKLYRASYVVDVDLSGSRIITLLLEKLIDAVMHPERNYSQLLLAKFPQQYDVNAPSVYNRIQAVLDHISAMTDTYALNLYRQLDGISIPSV